MVVWKIIRDHCVEIVFLGSLEKNACKSVENVNLEKHVTLYQGCVQMDVKAT